MRRCRVGQSGEGRLTAAITVGRGNSRRSRSSSETSAGRGHLKPARRARRRYSPTEVAPTFMLAAIFRLDRPSAHSRNTSRIFRVGYLFADVSTHPKGHPNSHHKITRRTRQRRHSPGRNHSESVVAAFRKQRSECVGKCTLDDDERPFNQSTHRLPCSFVWFRSVAGRIRTRRNRRRHAVVPGPMNQLGPGDHLGTPKNGDSMRSGQKYSGALQYGNAWLG